MRNKPDVLLLPLFFLLMALFIFVPKVNNKLIFYTLFVAGIIAYTVIISLFCDSKYDTFLILILITLNLFQNVIVACLVLPVEHIAYGRFFIGLNFILPFLLVVVLVIKRYKLIPKPLLSMMGCSFAFISYLVILNISSSYPFIAKMFYFRNDIFWLVAILLGVILDISASNFLKYILLLIGVYFVFGIIEYIMFENFWRESLPNNLQFLQIKAAAEKSGFMKNIFTSIGDVRYRRFASFFYSAINGAYNAVALFIIILYLGVKNTFIKNFKYLAPLLLFMLSICIFLSMVKGCWLFLIIFFIIYAVLHFPKMRSVWALIFLGFGSICFLYFVYQFLEIRSSASVHIRNLVESAKYIIGNFNIFGLGLGYGGNLARWIYSTELYKLLELKGEESGFATILVQTGIIGILLFLGTFVSAIKVCIKNYCFETRLVIAVLIAWMAATLFQEEALSPASIFLLMFFVGWLVKQALPKTMQ